MAKCSKILANNIRWRLKQLGISQADLAKKVGISAPYVNQVVKGTNQNPSLDSLEAIAEALGIALYELISDPKERAVAGHTLGDCLEVARNFLDSVDLKVVEKKPRDPT